MKNVADLYTYHPNFCKIQVAAAHRGQSRALLLRCCSRVQSYTPAPCSSQNPTLPHAASTDCKQAVSVFLQIQVAVAHRSQSARLAPALLQSSTVVHAKCSGSLYMVYTISRDTYLCKSSIEKIRAKKMNFARKCLFFAFQLSYFLHIAV